MKNVFWFLKKPADEREMMVFDRAYRASLHVLWLGLAFLVVAFNFIEEEISSAFIVVVGSLLLAVSYISGWLTLRTEDLVYSSAKSNTLPKPTSFLMAMALVATVGMVSVYFAPEKYFIVYLVTFSFIRVLLVAWSWAVLRHAPLHVRFLVSLIFPTFGISFSYFRKRSVILRLCLGLLFVVIYVGTLVTLTFGVRQFIVEPLVVATNVFAPDLSEGQYVLLDKTDRDFEGGDYVIVKKENGGVMVAKIISVDGEDVSVLTTVGELAVPRNRVMGSVIEEFDKPFLGE